MNGDVDAVLCDLSPTTMHVDLSRWRIQEINREYAEYHRVRGTEAPMQWGPAAKLLWGLRTSPQKLKHIYFYLL